MKVYVVGVIKDIGEQTVELNMSTNIVNEAKSYLAKEFNVAPDDIEIKDFCMMMMMMVYLTITHTLKLLICGEILNR